LPYSVVAWAHAGIRNYGGEVFFGWSERGSDIATLGFGKAEGLTKSVINTEAHRFAIKKDFMRWRPAIIDILESPHNLARGLVSTLLGYEFDLANISGFKPDIGSLILTEPVSSGGVRILSGFSSACSLLNYFLSLTQLIRCDSSVDGSGSKGKPGSDCKPYLLAVSAIIAGAVISFYCFWYLQFGFYYDRLWGLITVLLVLSFVFIAYGVYAILKP